MNSSHGKIKALDVLFFVFVIFGIGICLLIGLAMGIASIQAIYFSESDSLPVSVWGIFSFFFLALCGLPVLYFAARPIFGKDDHLISKPTSPLSYIPLFLFPLALAVGYFAYARQISPVILGPIAHIMAAAATVCFVIQISRQNGPALKGRRFWGQFIGGLWVVPVIALLVEIIIFIPIIILFLLNVQSMENGTQWLDLLLDPNLVAPIMPDELTAIILDPGTIAIVFLFSSVLVPIIEEILKTMVVWPWLYYRRPSQEALMGGILGGAGYALTEALFLSQQSQTWLPVMIGRAGATMMHTFTTALASWGLAEGFVQKRWRRTILSFAIAIGFHGLWNAAAISMAFSEIALEENVGLENILLAIQDGSPLLIILMSVIAVFGLPWITRMFTTQSDISVDSSKAEDTAPFERREPRRM